MKNDMRQNWRNRVRVKREKEKDRSGKLDPVLVVFL